MAYLQELIRSLRRKNCLWHRTDILGLRGILSSGYIAPNLGQFPNSYPQSEKSYGRHCKAISLFDFDTSAWRDCLRQRRNWLTLLTDSEPITILIGIKIDCLDRSQLRLAAEIPHSSIPTFFHDDGCSYIPMFIPFVEALYTGQITIDAFARYILLPYRSTNYCWNEVMPFSGALAKVERIINSQKRKDTKGDLSDDLERRLDDARKRIR
jgi:hypothetical protein